MVVREMIVGLVPQIPAERRPELIAELRHVVDGLERTLEKGPVTAWATIVPDDD